MNFDTPQARPWEDKKSPAFKKWLTEQIALSPEKWSVDFQSYVKIKISESEERVPYRESTAQEKKEKTFRRYLDVLNLTEQELAGKSILDVGCQEGSFVISCLDKGITQKAYGLDAKLEGDAMGSKYPKNFFFGDFTEMYPIRNLDYVVSVGALSLYLDEEHKVDVEVAIEEAIIAIKETGEIRIWSVHKALKGDDLDGDKEKERVVVEIMKKLEKRLGIEWKLEPTDIKAGINHDIWANQILIIKRK